MTHITTRDLQDYYTPLQCRSRISMLDKICGVSYNKLVWFKINGKSKGSTLRHIDVDDAIDAIRSYVIRYRHSTHSKVVKSLSTKKELLDVLLILKDK